MMSESLSEAETREGTPGGGSHEHVGPYKILQRIGEGGFGSVYAAEQEHPVKRRVALKVIKLGMDTEHVIARFEAERQALAMMDHPHIARVLDAGATAAGRPYYVMDLVKGEPITTYCDRNRLQIVDRLKLFDQVCSAVQHAHMKGVIHRDLKPSNVLVSTQDDKPFARVIDFGIAKATTARLTEKTLFTELHQMIGTPVYMSPEQAEGSSDIDTRTDIYSLGVLLYELLTGTTPLDPKSLRAPTMQEVQRLIRDAEPPRPSARLAQSLPTRAEIAPNRRAEPQRLMRAVRGELDWIAMKAIEKERERRYETANGLAMDIRRYLAGEPVLAAPPSAAYRLRKLVRRHRATVAAGLLVAATLLVGIVGFAWQTRVAQARADELEQVSRFQADMLKQVDPTEAGKLLSEDVRAKFAAALTKPGLAEQERAFQVRAFDEQWQRVNATDAARELIDRTILRPAVDAIEKQFKNQPTVDAALRQVLATRYREMGLHAAALPLQEQALSTRKRVLGPKHPSTLASVREMGRLLVALGRLTEAEPYFREALDGRRRVLGAEHPDTLSSISDMGSLLEAQGKLPEAESYYREALEGKRRVLGAEHTATLDSISDMGSVLTRQDRLLDAEPYYREALEKLRRVRGEDDKTTLRAIGDMGVLLQTLGRLSQAEPLYREVLEKRRRLLGEEHPHTLIAISNMGFLLLSEGKLTEAEPYCREAMEKTQRVLGKDHYSTLIAMSNLGRLLTSEARYADALKLLSPAEAVARRAFTGSNERRLASWLTSLGKARAALSLFGQAEANLLEAHAILVKTRGPTHQDTRECARAIVALYSGWKRPGKAAEWGNKAEAIPEGNAAPSPLTENSRSISGSSATRML